MEERRARAKSAKSAEQPCRGSGLYGFDGRLEKERIEL
jgi:hypothetical protein